MYWLPQKYWQLKLAHLFTQAACPVGPPALLVPTISALVLLEQIVYKLICLEQSISHRYLCVDTNGQAHYPTENQSGPVL
jgi:hypothetical protein